VSYQRLTCNSQVTHSKQLTGSPNAHITTPEAHMEWPPTTPTISIAHQSNSLVRLTHICMPPDSLKHRAPLACSAIKHVTIHTTTSPSRPPALPPILSAPGCGARARGPCPPPGLDDSITKIKRKKANMTNHQSSMGYLKHRAPLACMPALTGCCRNAALPAYLGRVYYSHLPP
jgi:hypothetical protein